MYIESYTRIDFIKDMFDFFKVNQEIRTSEFKIYDEALTTQENIDWYNFKKYIIKKVQYRNNMPAPAYFLDLFSKFIILPKGITGDKIKFTLKGIKNYNELEFTEVSWAKKSINDIKNEYKNDIINIQRIKKDY